MNLFIFGSTGDLVKRKVLPALNKRDLKDLNIFAIGRRDFIDEVYFDFACKKEDKIKDRIHYFKTEFDKYDICEECEKGLSKGEINYFYVSLPPNLYLVVFNKIKKIKEKGYKVSVLVEKPFGNSLKEAKELSGVLESFDLDKDVLINDHYLFKKEILQLKKQYFQELKISFAEKLGLENRITYYDSVGALVDMVQSHLLNILFKFLSKDEINNLEVVSYEKKQYDGYEKELGMESQTETFVRIILKTGEKNIELITGKKFSKKESILLVDNKKMFIEIGDPYIEIFNNFLENKKENFLKIENVFEAWKIIEKIKQKENKLTKYDSGIKFSEIEKDLKVKV